MSKKKTLSKNILSLAISTVALVVCQSGAAEEGSDASWGIEEIVVTAQKRAESLQDVPVAVSAFSGDALDAAGVREAMDLATSVPNLQIGNSLSNIVLNLPGISTETFTVASDPSVAFYVDGVYRPRTTSPSAAFLDVERLEVLRGPQGTLYGRNATGGAVNVISKKASVEGFEAFGDVTVGNYNTRKVRGVVNMPLVEDQLVARVAFLKEDRDGYQEVMGLPSGAEDNNAADDLAARGQIVYLPNEAMELQVITDYYKKDGPDSNHFKQRNAFVAPSTNPFLWATATPNPDDPFKIYQNDENDSKKESTNVAATFNWDLNDYSFKTIVSWQDHQDLTSIDLDGSDADILVFNSEVFSETYTAEVQLSSETESDFQWITGLYYFNEKAKNVFLTPSGAVLDAIAGFIVPGATDFGDLTNIHRSENTAWAAFGEGYYQLTDASKLTMGVRYSYDEKEGSSENVETFLFGADGVHPRSYDEDAITWKLGLDWDVNEASMAYVTVSSGYKAGGFNMEQAPAGFPQEFDSESLVSFEIGSKNQLWNDRAQLNLAAFYYDYTDFQVNQVISTGGGVTQSTSNAGAATVYGMEVEYILRATEHLTLSGQYSYLNTEFDEFDNVDEIEVAKGVQDLSGNSFARSPENTFTLVAEYDFTFDSGATLKPRVQYYWQDDMNLRPYERPADDVEDFARIDASLTFESEDGSWSVKAFVNNLENKTTENYVFVGPEFLGIPEVAYYSSPRTYGLILGYSFQ